MGLFSDAALLLKLTSFLSLNVAKLAHVPPDVLELAAVKSSELEETVKQNKLAHV